MKKLLAPKIQLLSLNQGRCGFITQFYFGPGQDAVKLKFEREFFDNFLSENTRKSYAKDLQDFAKFLMNNNATLDIRKLERLHVIAYKKHLEEIGQAPKTIIRKLASISSYWRELLAQKLANKNITSGIRRPKCQVVNETRDIEDHKAIKMQELAISKKKASALHKAILVVMFGTGMRKQEIIDLTMNNYQEEEGYKIFRFKGKGGKIRTVVLRPDVVAHIEEYLQFMRGQDREVMPEDPMFQPSKLSKGKYSAITTHLKKPISRFTIDYIVQRYARLAGVQGRVSAHSVRATVISHLIENHSQDIYRISSDMGHSDVKTTKLYDKRIKKHRDSALLKSKIVL